MNALSLIEQILVEKANSKLACPESKEILTKPVLPIGYSPFAVGPLGNFPYYWQDPSNLSFNANTYRWISSALQANANPVKLDGVFTNGFLQVLSKIVYVLSKADQKKLTAERSLAIREQHNLLLAWKTAFGNLPLGTSENPTIDLIVENIVTQWAKPPTDLYQLVNSTQPKTILNNTPPQGGPVVPELIIYLKALSSALPLLNRVTKYYGLLLRSIAAVQNPCTKNGAILTNEGKLVPAYEIYPSVADIIAGLSNQSPKQTVTLNIDAKPVNNNELQITAPNQQTAKSASAEILAISQPGKNKPASPLLSMTDNASKLDVAFVGTTTVQFSPKDFSLTSLKNWFWAKPITDAIANGNSDISGYQFSPKPNVNFSETGNFGYITSIIISNNPLIKITTSEKNAAEIETLINKSKGSELRFLDRKLGAVNSGDGYAVKRRGKQVIMRATPNLSNTVNTDATAFVLGVTTHFPAAS